MIKEKQTGFMSKIIIFFVLLFIYSKWGPSLPVSLLTQTKGEPLIVTETGKITAIPNIAKISLGIQEQGSSLKTVQTSVNTKSKKLTDELKKLGVDEKNIKTTSYNVYPEYDYNSTPYRLSGYRVSTAYEVKITDFEKVNDALIIATNVGANVVGNITFEVNEKTKEELVSKAREEAVKKAKDKAKSLASSAGITLGKIINISESTESDYPRPIMLANKEIGDTELMTANIEPGETEIQTTVSLYFEIR